MLARVYRTTAVRARSVVVPRRIPIKAMRPLPRPTLHTVPLRLHVSPIMYVRRYSTNIQHNDFNVVKDDVIEKANKATEAQSAEQSDRLNPDAALQSKDIDETQTETNGTLTSSRKHLSFAERLRERMGVLYERIRTDQDPEIRKLTERFKDPRELNVSPGVLTARPTLYGDYENLSIEALGTLDFGNLLAQLGKYDRALEVMYEVLADNPNSAYANYALGRYSLLTNDIKRARHHLKRALELNPNFPACVVLYSKLLIARGKVNKAVELIDRARIEHPNDCDLLYALAQANLARQHIDKAEEIAKKLLKLEPDRAEYNVLMGLIAGAKRDDKVAIEHYEKANSQVPNCPELMLKIAQHYAASSALDKATAYLDSIISTNKRFTPAYVGKAMILVVLQQLDEGLVLLKECVNENPTDTGALMAYGLYIARMPPFFPRPTARPDTLAFPVYSEEAANVIAKALELLAEKRKNLMLGNIQLKKPQALSTTDKGIKIPTLSEVITMRSQSSKMEILHLMGGSYDPDTTMISAEDEANMRTYLGFYWMVKAVNDGLVEGVPKDVLASPTKRVDWVMEELQKYEDERKKEEASSKFESEDRALRQHLETLKNSNLGVNALMMGVIPKSSTNPEATSTKKVLYLDAEKKIVHPLHKAKVNLFAAHKLLFTPSVNTLYWLAMYFKLRKLNKESQIMLSALAATLIQGLPKRLIEVVNLLVTSSSEEETSKHLDALERIVRDAAAKQNASVFGPPALKLEKKYDVLRVAEQLATLGYISMESHSARSAGGLFQAALSLNPRQGFARITCAKLLQALHQENDARALLEDWVQGDPLAFEGHFELAKMAMKSSPPNTADAIKHLDAVLKIVELYDARLMLVDVLLQLKEASQALPHLQKLLKHNETSELHQRMGQAYLIMEKYDSAIASLRRAVTMDDANGQAWMMLYTAMKKKNYDAGSLEFALKKVIAALPKYIKAYTELVQLLLAANRKSEAKEYLAKVYEIRGEPIPHDLKQSLNREESSAQESKPKQK